MKLTSHHVNDMLGANIPVFNVNKRYALMDWQEEYNRKLVQPEEAVKAVKSGDRVCFSLGRQPLALGMALAARKEELKGVKIVVPAPDRDFPWYDPGWEDSFEVSVLMPLPAVYPMIEQHACDIDVGTTPFGGVVMNYEEKPVDVFLLEVSPPDEHGFCSFGQSIWEKHELLENAKVVLGEINGRLIRTFGSNYVHVSEIDYFVEHTPSEQRRVVSKDLRGATTKGPKEEIKAIAEYISSLVRDGDTIEIGVGTTTEWIPHFGPFNSKQDLGWHSEHTPGWIIDLIRCGIMSGARKNIHRGKAIATAVGGTGEHLAFVHMNPMFELYPLRYVADIRTIAANDNMVALNNALAIDLTGQITAQSIGSRLFSAEGGQVCFVLGALLSKGGRSIHVLPSTAAGGTASRIVTQFEPGTIVTTSRGMADIVVTEYGIARLRGKTQRERTQELINIAHPDFRSALQKEAKRLFWP